MAMKEMIEKTDGAQSDRMVILTAASEEVRVRDAPLSCSKLDILKYLARTLSLEIETLQDNHMPDVSTGINFYDEVQRFEIILIKSALKHTRGKQKYAARLLGLSPSTLSAFIKRYNI
ncbi:MAG: hypothetical protein ICV60_23735 [Pyrinomonadaceae bacterium]|nr:hypothetical protein [Pyrinomonadaceae bacterium]